MDEVTMRTLTLILCVIPTLSYRLITSPDTTETSPPDTKQQNEWDIVVSSDPIRVTQKQKNKTRTSDHAIRFDHNTLTDGRERSRSFKDCKLNDIRCLYENQGEIQQQNQNPGAGSNANVVDRFLEKFSGITNAKFNEEGRNETKKSHWSLINAEKHHHPYDDKRGWVTLDPVPWSVSQVSKWKPHHQGSYPHLGHTSQQERPWAYSPGHAHVGQVGHRPAAHWGIANNEIITDQRPSDFPQDYNVGASPPWSGPQQHNQNYRPASYYPDHQDPYRPTRPFPYQDQATPSPSYNFHPGYRPSNLRHPSTYPKEGNGEWVLLSTTKGYSMPQWMREQATERNDNETQLGVSRNMRSKYHEQNLDNEQHEHNEQNEHNEHRKSDNMDGLKILHTEGGGSILSSDTDEKPDTSDDMDGLTILHTKGGASILTASKERSGRTKWGFDDKSVPIQGGDEKDREGQSKTFKRTVRLTVLPPKDSPAVTAHDGLLEVSPSTTHQTVEQDQMNHERLNKLSQLSHVSSNIQMQIPPSQRQQMQLIPVAVTHTRSRQLGDKRTAVLAALGAGMIPATMAMLVPVALGK